jgi:hypothetical protein
MSEHHSGDHHISAGASRPYRRDLTSAEVPSAIPPQRPWSTSWPLPTHRPAPELPELVRGSIEENLADLPSRRRVARCLRGSVVLGAPEPSGAVTLRFAADGIEVSDGADPDAVVLQGEAATLLEVCLGRRSPVRALRDRRLRLSGRRGVLAAAGAVLVLSLPAAFYRGRGTNRPASRPVA